jgi:sugar lactone lactonase YvrE
MLRSTRGSTLVAMSRMRATIVARLALAGSTACGARTGLVELSTAPPQDAATVAAPSEAGLPWCDSEEKTLADGQQDPVAIALGAGLVGWTTQPLGEPSTGGVYVVPIFGGATFVLSALEPFPLGLALDSNNAYWTNQWGGSVEDVSVGGGMPTALATNQGSNNPSWLVVDSTSVYWTSFGDESASTGAVLKVPLQGGQTISLAEDQTQPWAIAVDEADVYWTNVSEDDDSGGAIMAVPLGGGPTSTIAAGLHLPNAIALDADSVYVTTAGTHAGAFLDGQVLKVPKAGGAPTVLASMQQGAGGIAVDEGNVYWVDAATRDGDGTVMQTAKTGGAPMTLASGQASPAAVATQNHCVYWVNAGTAARHEADGTVKVIAGR